MRFVFTITILLLLSFRPSLIKAQQDSLLANQSIPQKDITDIIKGRHAKEFETDRSGKMHFAVLPAAGYTIQTGFAGVLSTNIAFYTKLGVDQKLSSISSSISYSQYDQTIFPTMANIWSKNGKWNYVGDWRYMKYPSETWGLGGQKDPVDGFTINFSYLKLHQLVLRSVAKNLYIGTGYYLDSFWDIREVNAPPDHKSSFQKYGLYKNELASGIPFRILYDSRLNSVNPTNGWHASFTFRENLKSLKSKQDWQSIVLDVRKYIRFPANSDNILALWSYNWITMGRAPYLLLPSTGWDDYYNTGRGYIQGRFRSKNMIYFEAEYRFKLTNNGLLGGVVFGNLESYKKNLTTGPNNFAPAYGGGLRVKLNKESNANLCIDYGIGKNGSQGFFVNLGEVF